MKNQRVLSAIACLFLAVASTYSQAAAQQDRTTVQIQNLIEKLSTNDDKTRFETFQSLSKIGSAAVPALVEVLNQGRGYGRVYAARTLRKIEPNNQLVQPTLVAISKDKQETLEARRYAAYVLALSSTGVPELAKMLEDQDVFVRRSAAFALQELFAISASLTPDYGPLLTNALAVMIAEMGDLDSIVRGIAVETIEQVRGDIDFALDYCIEKSPNGWLRENAKQVKEKRKRGIKELGQQLTMDMKPGADEDMKQNRKFLFGVLGVIYAIRIGGEPVEDFRSLPDVDGWCLRITLNPITHHAGSGQSRFNPYQDLK